MRKIIAAIKYIFFNRDPINSRRGDKDGPKHHEAKEAAPLWLSTLSAFSAFSMFTILLFTFPYGWWSGFLSFGGGTFLFYLLNGLYSMWKDGYDYRPTKK